MFNINNINDVHIAQNEQEARMGLKDSSKNAMLFPNSNRMTMKGMKSPVKYYGLKDGVISDEGVAYPGEDFNVNGDSTLEFRLRNGGFTNRRKFQQSGMSIPEQYKSLEEEYKSLERERQNLLRERNDLLHNAKNMSSTLLNTKIQEIDNKIKSLVIRANNFSRKIYNLNSSVSKPEPKETQISDPALYNEIQQTLQDLYSLEKEKKSQYQKYAANKTKEAQEEYSNFLKYYDNQLNFLRNKSNSLSKQAYGLVTNPELYQQVRDLQDKMKAYNDYKNYHRNIYLNDKTKGAAERYDKAMKLYNNGVENLQNESRLLSREAYNIPTKPFENYANNPFALLREFNTFPFRNNPTEEDIYEIPTQTIDNNDIDDTTTTPNKNTVNTANNNKTNISNTTTTPNKNTVNTANNNKTNISNTTTTPNKNTVNTANNNKTNISNTTTTPNKNTVNTANNNKTNISNTANTPYSDVNLTGFPGVNPNGNAWAGVPGVNPYEQIPNMSNNNAAANIVSDENNVDYTTDLGRHNVTYTNGVYQPTNNSRFSYKTTPTNTQGWYWLKDNNVPNQTATSTPNTNNSQTSDNALVNNQQQTRQYANSYDENRAIADRMYQENIDRDRRLRQEKRPKVQNERAHQRLLNEQSDDVFHERLMRAQADRKMDKIEARNVKMRNNRANRYVKRLNKMGVYDFENGGITPVSNNNNRTMYQGGGFSKRYSNSPLTISDDIVKKNTQLTSTRFNGTPDNELIARVSTGRGLNQSYVANPNPTLAIKSNRLFNYDINNAPDVNNTGESNGNVSSESNDTSNINTNNETLSLQQQYEDLGYGKSGLTKGDKVGLYGEYLPAMYNLAYSIIPPYRTSPKYNRHRYRVYNDLARQQAPSDYSDIYGMMNKGMRDIRQGSPNAQVERANRLALYQQTMDVLGKQKTANFEANREMALQATKNLGEIGEHERAAEEAARLERISHEEARDAIRAKGIGQFGAATVEYGRALNNALNNRMKWNLLSQIYNNYGMGAYQQAIDNGFSTEEIILFKNNGGDLQSVIDARNAKKKQALGTSVNNTSIKSNDSNEIITNEVIGSNETNGGMTGNIQTIKK